MDLRIKEHMKKVMDSDGFFKIAAIDHRAVYINQYKEIVGDYPTVEIIKESKIKIIKELKPYISSVLLDPLYCLHDVVKDNILEEKGLIIGIEGEDYLNTVFNDDYLTKAITIDEIEELNCDCVKLFLYYDDETDVKIKQQELVHKISKSCHEKGLPFLLEPILSPKYDDLSISQTSEYYNKMITAFSDSNVDIYKIKFPFDLNKVSEELAYHECKCIIELSDAPFILLTSGITEEGFFKQLDIFCKAGGSGYAMGRSLWKNGLKAATSENMIKVVKRANSIVDNNGTAYQFN